MKVDGRPYRSLWREGRVIHVIDQHALPFDFRVAELRHLEDLFEAIATMRVRGAPLIGACGAYGIAIALGEDPSDEGLRSASERLLSARPTAVNLRWAIERVVAKVSPLPPPSRAAAALAEADAICEEDVSINHAIGRHGLPILRTLQEAKGDAKVPVNIMTHCNAGWIATVDWGTITSPIYQAHDDGIPVHVWVSETRPRNQGARLTAWELAAHGVPHTVVTDSACGHLIQRGLVDICLVGTDRTTARGEVCNKIGTYLKALACKAHEVPFYACVPTPSIDWSIEGKDIPIEERDGAEVRIAEEGGKSVRLANPSSQIANPAFDVTPPELVTGLITELGVVPPARLDERFGPAARESLAEAMGPA